MTFPAPLLRMNVRFWIAGGALVAAAAAIARAQPPAPVAGVVFEDANRNGRRDAGERGLSRVAVSNQRGSSRPLRTAAIRFRARRYGLVFISLPDGYAAVGDFWWGIPSANSPADFALTRASGSGTFTFMHASDTHVARRTSPTAAAAAIAEKHRPDFVLVTGDLVRDALRVGEEEARGYYDLYTQEVRRFPMPVWSVPGNHETSVSSDISRWSAPPIRSTARGCTASDSDRTITRSPGGIHFVGLDSVDIADLSSIRAPRRGPAGVAEGGPLAGARLTRRSSPSITFLLRLRSIVWAVIVTTARHPRSIKVGGRTVFRHIVSNLSDVLAVDRIAGMAAGARRPYARPRDDQLRIHGAHALSSGGGSRRSDRQRDPRDSGVTLYRVKNRVIDDGEFIPLR